MRPAVAADVADLRALAVAAYESYVPRIGRAPAPTEADYANAIRRAEVWVAVQHDLLVGLLVLVPQPDHLLVENIAVLPSTQGHGIGTGLLDLAENQARRHGLAELRPYTNEAMTENLACYPRRGYVETHRAEQDGFLRVFFSKPVAR